MLYFIYQILQLFLSPFIFLSLILKSEGKLSFRKNLEYLGISKANNQELVLFHCVSVGEVIAATPLIKQYIKQKPNKKICITTTTLTGYNSVIDNFKETVTHCFMPLDFCFFTSLFFNNNNITKINIIETELWPSFLTIAHSKKIQINLLNARLSERSKNRYLKFPKTVKWLISNIDQVLAKHADDAKRFIELGVSTHKIHVTGSIKFDIEIEPSITKNGIELRSKLGDTRPIWIAASTHEGEDEQVLTAHKKVLKEYPNALLILVPRHPQRFNDVFNLCKVNELRTIRRTSALPLTENIQIYLADTMGEMLTLLAASDICFMGGSLIGDKVGGHNLLEPAALGLPLITGPSYYNFTEITKQLLDASALETVQDPFELGKQIIFLITNKKTAYDQGRSALKVVTQNQGSIAKTLLKI